jgi:hypothetical protein
VSTYLSVFGKDGYLTKGLLMLDSENSIDMDMPYMLLYLTNIKEERCHFWILVKGSCSMQPNMYLSSKHTSRKREGWIRLM